MSVTIDGTNGVTTPTNTYTGSTAPTNGIYLPSTNTIGISSNSTKVLSVVKGSSLALEGATPQTGTGITFPATQSASSEANTLDDYEEGTWTPADGSGAGLTFTVSDARYTKIGRMVECYANITYPSTANGNTATIGGLPFTSANTTAGSYGAFTVYSTYNIATWLNTNNSTTSVAYSLAGASLTNATLSGKNFRLVWIYEV